MVDMTQMTSNRTYYDVLGITPKAPPEIVVAVYRAWMQALKVHPDLGGDEELAKAINAAYETIKDPERRAKYDMKLKKAGAVKMEEGKRRAPRVEVNAQIAFCIPPSGKWLPAQAVDASSLGLKIRTVEMLHLGMHVSIAFPECALAAVEAEVRWARPLADGRTWRHESGIEFFNPVPDILKRVGGQGNSG